MKSASLTLLAMLVVACLLPIGLAFAHDEIPIGAEIGPEFIWNDWFISKDHATFRANSYFFPQMRSLGFNTLTQSYVPTLNNTGGGVNADRMAEIFDSCGLRLLINPRGFVANGHTFDGVNSIRRENLSFKGWNPANNAPTALNHADFFVHGLDSLGNATLYYPNGQGNDNFPYWITDRNPGGYIIGKPGVGNNNLADNWDPLGAGYKAFCLGNNYPDKYQIRFLMREVNRLTAPNATLLTLYIKSSSYDYASRSFNLTDAQVHDSISYYADPGHANWGWVVFDLGDSLVGSHFGGSDYKVYFALQWHGDLTGAGHGILKTRAISYQSKESKLLFPDPFNPDSLDATYYNPFDSVLQSDLGRFSGGQNAVGFEAKEPYKFGLHSANRILDGFKQSAGDNYLTAVQEPSLTSRDDMDEYLGQMHAPLFLFDRYPINYWIDTLDDSDNWHWENSFKGDDENGIIGNSIQGAFSHWIDSAYGMRNAVEACHEDNKDIWIGIQSSCEMKPVDGGFHELHSSLGWMAEPTPRMIKCMGFLAMTFAPKGFFYSYYGCLYGADKDRFEGHDYYDFYAEPTLSHPTRYQYFNGAIISGLVSLHKNIGGGDTTDVVTSYADIEEARAQTGYLLPNAKGYAAKEFNDYVHSVEGVYAGLRLTDSWCAQTVNPANGIEIESTIHPDSAVADTETWVQVARFRQTHFMLVNRRCAADERRTIHVRVSPPAVMESCGLKVYEANGQIDTVQFGLYGNGDISFSYTLEPGEGRLFGMYPTSQWPSIISVYTEFQGDMMISDSITITSTGTLKILPGSNLIFTDDGKIKAIGKLQFAGKSDANGDSLITVSGVNTSATAPIELTGTQTDTISYTSFKHLDKGLKVAKSGSNKVVVDHCEFAYNKNEGLYVSGGEVKATACTFSENAGDGAYFYNTKATLDSLTVSRNEKNGLYFYSVNAASTLKHSTLLINGQGSDSSPQGNVMFYNCSPTLEKNDVTSGAEYGLYGASGAHPILHNTSTAANTVTGNASHETYWNASYPSLDYGHNNFDVADDTIIYITNTSLSTFYARNNYWGNTMGPNISGSSRSYYGPGTFLWSPADGAEQQMIRNDDALNVKAGNAGFGGRISEADDEAEAALLAAIDAEADRPNIASQDYRRIIERFGETSAAPIAVERLLWMVRNQFADDNQRNVELDRLSRFYRSLADTSHAPGLVWKARRAALWALAAQHRYDEAIRGFEAIVERHDNLADSVFAVIDVGTLQLEAREWATRDSGAHVQSMFGSKHELCPSSFEAHRKHTDELLGLLGVDGGAHRPTIPTEYFLDQNFPNPFNAVTQIKYGLPEASDVKLRIYDLMGREVITLIQGQQKAGYYRMLWDGKNAEGMQVSSGMYFVRLETPKVSKVSKMTLVK